MTAPRKTHSFFLLLCCIFSAANAQETPSAGAGQNVVTIHRSQKTETKKSADGNSDILFFTGGVELTVANEKNTVKIAAEVVQYDRGRQMLYAQGPVTLQQMKGDISTETLSANSLLFNVQSLEGVFDTGQIFQAAEAGSQAVSGNTLQVSSDLFAKGQFGTMAFKNGVITFCDDPNPHWKIRATRLWLLPGGEFAFLNGLLYIGEVPIFYLPAFYFPKDELIFNPVIGYRQREGYYVQTTTYLLGRRPQTKKSDTGFSFSENTRPREQRLEGLFLRNLESNLEQAPPYSLKLMFDAYANLGVMLGIGGTYEHKNNLFNLDSTISLGFSRLLFPAAQTSGIYVPFDPETGIEHRDVSQLFGVSLPFRYGANITMSTSVKPVNFRLSMPLYSDPYFSDDFLRRSETMDWVNFLASGGGLTETDANNLLSSFKWSFTGSINPDVSALAPYVTSLQMNNITFEMQFMSKNDTTLTGAPAAISPMRTFFVPQQLTPLNFGLNIAGTPFSTNASNYPSKKKTSETAGNTTPITFITPPELSQKKDKEQPSSDSADSADLPPDEEAKKKEAESLDLQKKLFPELPLSSLQYTSVNGLDYSLKYALSPVFSSQNMYSVEHIKSPADIRWDNFLSTYYSISGTAEIINNVTWKNNAVNWSNRFVFQPVYQRHPYVSEEYYTGAQQDQIVLNDFLAQKLDVSNINSLTIKPFVFSRYFADTSFSWNITTKLLRTTFTGTVDSPEWDYVKPGWNKESVTSHTLNANLASRQNEFSQSLQISASMQPQLPSYTGTLTLGFPYLRLSLSGGIKKLTETAVKWTYNSLQQTASLNLFNKKMSITENFQYSIEEKHPISLQTGLSMSGFSASFTMQYTNKYRIDPSVGWVIQQKKEFIPVNMSFSYNSPSKQFLFWKNRIYLQPSLSTSLVFDMVRPTNSYFTFKPSITFRINRALDITFGSESRNDVVLRYFQDLIGFEYQLPGEQNILLDLFNSFAFWDEKKRLASGFKLSNLFFKMEYDLHDWVLAAEVKVNPRLLHNAALKPYYDFSPYISLSVIWRPFSMVKASLADEYGTLKLNP